MAKSYGPWEIIENIGVGGQGHVYLVRDTRNADATNYALKRLINKQRIDRFKREVQTALALNHENILRIVDYDLEAEKPYFVAALSKGISPYWVSCLCPLSTSTPL